MAIAIPPIDSENNMATSITDSPEYAEAPANDLELKTLGEVKHYIGMGGSTDTPDPNDPDDAEITAVIRAASRFVQSKLDYRVITTVGKFWFPCWPNQPITFRPGPIQSLAIQYAARGEADMQDLPAANYQATYAGMMRDEVTVVFIKQPTGLKTPTVAGENILSVNLGIGFGDDVAAAPPELGEAVLLLVNNWYDNRSATSPGTWQEPTEMPFGVRELIEQYSRTMGGVA